jgi:hypothetical protein
MFSFSSSTFFSSFYFLLLMFFLLPWINDLSERRLGEKRNAYRILVGKPEGKRPLRRPRRRCVDNIKMDLREIGLGGMDWIDLSQDRDWWRALVNTAMTLRVP